MDNCEVLRSAFLQVDMKYKKYIVKLFLSGRASPFLVAPGNAISNRKNIRVKITYKYNDNVN